MNGKDWSLKNLDKVYSKRLQNFNMDGFSWYNNSFDFNFLNVVAFESSYKFHFSTSHDLNAANHDSAFPLLYGC